MQNKLPMKEFVIQLLKTNTPATYYYHNYHHTMYVMEKAAEIGKYENCTEDELELLQVAALWHDAGYINTYKDHEEESCVLARKYLSANGYTIDDIEKICGMIMATKIPQLPKNKLEKIIADADMEYLGTKNAAKWSNDLYKELNVINPLLTRKNWNDTEIDFLTNHQFFTGYCLTKREHIKQSYLKSLINNHK